MHAPAARSLARIAHALGLLGVTALAVGCTAVLTPHDGIERCGSSDDCPPTGDNRYIAECRFDDESDLDATRVEQVCVAAFDPSIHCDPAFYAEVDPDHPLVVAFESSSTATRYGCTDALGARGCPPDPGLGCEDGLEPREPDGLCDVEGGGTDVVSLAGRTELAGQDVLDQFCRSFFCDDTFVCDVRDFRCVPCDPRADFAEGGCGTVYVAGAPSCIYTPDTRSVCDGADASVDSPKFGDC